MAKVFDLGDRRRYKKGKEVGRPEILDVLSSNYMVNLAYYLGAESSKESTAYNDIKGLLVKQLNKLGASEDLLVGLEELSYQDWQSFINSVLPGILKKTGFSFSIPPRNGMEDKILNNIMDSLSSSLLNRKVRKAASVALSEQDQAGDTAATADD